MVVHGDSGGGCSSSVSRETLSSVSSCLVGEELGNHGQCSAQGQLALVGSNV